MVHQGFKRRFSPLKLLADEQIENIHRSTLRVLEKTGLRIEHERAFRIRTPAIPAITHNTYHTTKLLGLPSTLARPSSSGVGVSTS